MIDPLALLLADGVIDEVLGRLKSGKEADISLVRRGGDIVAAKVYKDRSTRNFKNNAEYTEGRKVRNSRTQRSIERGSRFGRDAAEAAWKSAEVDALYTLAAAGVRVPRPVLFYEGVLLMELVLGDDGSPAPRLADVALDPGAAGKVFADLRAQMITMLCCGLIHGDLSPYNVLAGAHGPTIIDFPQVLSAAHSTRAEFFFERDFTNLLHYAMAFDRSLLRHQGEARTIWRAYMARELTPGYVPPPTPPPRRTEVRPRPRPQNDGRGPRAGTQNDGRGPRAGTQNDGRGPRAGTQPPRGGTQPPRPNADARGRASTQPPARPRPGPRPAAPSGPAPAHPHGGHRRRPKRRW